MATKKIKMQQYNGTGYDVLYPETDASVVNMLTYAKAAVNAALANTDTVEIGLGKLEKQISDVAAGSGYVTLTGVEELTNKTLTSPKINENVVLTATASELNVLDGIPAGLTATEIGYLDGVTGAIQTQLNGKRAIAPRVGTAASNTSLTIDADSYDQYNLTAMTTGAATINAPTGTLVSGQKLIIRLKDDGTARALTWNAIFRAIGVTLPTTTVVGKTTYVACIYNTNDTKWDVVAVAQEA